MRFAHVSYSLNSLKGGFIGEYIGDYYRGIKGGTRSLDYSSCGDSQSSCIQGRKRNLRDSCVRPGCYILFTLLAHYKTYSLSGFPAFDRFPFPSL